MAAPPLLTLQDIHLTFGGDPVLQGAEMMVLPEETVCLVGRNGSGKSTLLKIAAGLIECEEGTRFVRPGTTVRYLPQEPDLSGYADTLSYVQEGLEDGDDPYRAAYLLDQLGLTGEEDPAHLSGGESRRAALARILAPRPDVLLLDEPTNHLDLPTIEWLEKELKSLRRALVLISHDRRFLEKLSRATVWLDRGQTRRLGKGFAHFEAWRDNIIDQEDRTQQKLDRKIVREEHWLRYGVSGRRKRNVRRLDALHTLRQDKHDHRKRVGNVSLQAGEGNVSSKLVIEAKEITKSFDEFTVIEDFSVRIQRGDRIGIVGPNGAGKTTLLNMLTGGLKPDTGRVRMGTFLEIATMDQNRETLDPRWTVSQALTGDSGDHVDVQGEPRHVIGYMKDFLFTPDMVNTPITVLSGGERGRLMLARALSKKSNMLVLDEPTNDLDLETLDLLQEMLGDYAGTVLLVSHDRDFLDRVVTSVIASDAPGHWLDYAGGYTDMIAQRGAGVEEMDSARGQSVEKKRKGRKSSSKGRASAANDARGKLSFKDKYALESLPKEMDALAVQITELQTALADADFYPRDPDGFTKATADLVAAESRRAAAEEEWLALELLREDVEGS
ncbi:MAG: ATP-binding cassette domain-containing protein [Rhodospirillaceae bacterium]|jgi:ABC transport system ATP-binding/permease protein|nr:ATP-binding cassette domain-containing protein [Rhodospirillaceae bacterium]MBT6088947.1 ATP-binding cassette domain-containing protein [Rhodospirillaceae bacterium]